MTSKLKFILGLILAVPLTIFPLGNSSITSQEKYPNRIIREIIEKQKEQNIFELGKLLLTEKKAEETFLKIYLLENIDLATKANKVAEIFYFHVSKSRSKKCNKGIVVPLFSFKEIQKIDPTKGTVSFKYLILESPKTFLHHSLLGEKEISPFSLNKVEIPQTKNPAILTVIFDPSILKKENYKMYLAAFCPSSSPDWFIESKLIVK